MKITDLRTRVVFAHRTNFVFVFLDTDEGINGVGEATLEFGELAVSGALTAIKELIVGSDPFRTEHIIERLNRDSYWRGGPVLRTALSGIDAALLDIKGKALGVPVYDLLGGLKQRKLRAYGNAWFVGASKSEEFAQKALAAVKRGINALKWDPFGASYMTMNRQERLGALDCVASVRDAVGKDVELMIEGHGRFDVATAIAIANDLEEFDITWFEEPLPPESIDALAGVRRKSPIPIATGERYCEPARFLELLKADAVDYLQPDVSHVGGLSELKRICSMADMHGIPVCPHNPLGPVTNAMTVQVAASQSNIVWLETMMSDVLWRNEIASEAAVLSGSVIVVPDDPGLGVEIFEANCEKFPYQQQFMRHFNGELTNIRPA